MKYKTRKLLGRFAAALIVIALVLSAFSCAKAPTEDGAVVDSLKTENNIPSENNEQITEQPEQPKDKAEPCDVTIDEYFMPDQVVVTLTKEESAKGIKYTEKDFAEYGVINVFPYNDYYPEKFYPEYKNRQTLVLMIEQYSKQAVLDCVKKLEQDSRVYSSEPWFSFHYINRTFRYGLKLVLEESALGKYYMPTDFPELIVLQELDDKDFGYQEEGLYFCSVDNYQDIRELLKDERVKRVYYIPVDNTLSDLENIFVTDLEENREYTKEDFPYLELSSITRVDEKQYMLTISNPGFRGYIGAIRALESDGKRANIDRAYTSFH